MDDFASFIEKQRAELQKKRSALTAEVARIQSELVAIDREFAAITAYEQAKSGKAVRTVASIPTRQRRGGVREQVLAAIAAAQGGINRADLLVQLEAKGNTKAEQSISNALANLKKAGTIAAQDGKYTSVSG